MTSVLPDVSAGPVPTFPCGFCQGQPAGRVSKCAPAWQDGTFA
jgi:hypothetical protein